VLLLDARHAATGQRTLAHLAQLAQCVEVRAGGVLHAAHRRRGGGCAV
jgi:hypothetical protein